MMKQKYLRVFSDVSTTNKSKAGNIDKLNTIWKLITNVRFFLLLYLLHSILYSIPFFGYYLAITNQLLLLWSIVLIANSLLCNLKSFLKLPMLFVVITFIFYVFTMLLSIRENFFVHSKLAIYNGINLIIVFFLHKDEITDEITDGGGYVKLVNDIIILLTFALSLVALIFFFTNTSVNFLQGVDVVKIGFFEGRLFGPYISPNTGAVMSYLSVATSIINFYSDKRKRVLWRIIYSANFIVQLIYVPLSGSRGGSIAIIACIAVASFFLMMKKYIGAKGFVIRGIITALICIIGATALVLFTNYFVKAVAVKAVTVIHAEFNELGDQDILYDANGEVLTTEREDSKQYFDTGRFQIWTGGVSLIGQRPIFGYGYCPRYTENNILNYNVDDSKFNSNVSQGLKHAKGNMHNVYIQVAVSSGILGLIAFMSIIIFTGLKGLWCIGRMNSGEFVPYLVATIIMAIFVSLLVNGMVESHLMFNRQDPIAIIFWYYAGLLLVCNRKLGKECTKVE